MTAPKLSKPAHMFLAHARTVGGYQQFLQAMTDSREHALHVAIYGQNTEQRSIASGRAQAWTEIIKVFTDTPNS